MIITDPDPRLRQVSMPLADEDDRDFIREMFRAMYEAPGVGLTAIQIGIPKRVCVVDLQTNGVKRPRVFINPRLLSTASTEVEYDEGCLSVPGVHGVVKRSPYIALSWYDLDGSQWHDDFGGFLAHVIQHEIDHMNGILFTDKLIAEPAL